MQAIEGALVAVFVGSSAGILLVFGLYPLALLLVGSLRPRPRPPRVVARPSSSLLVAVRNGEGLVTAKVENTLALRGTGPAQVVFVSDGSTDRTVERLETLAGERIEVLALAEHRGKAHALNLAVQRCHGEILVFSDADALLAPDALDWLLAPFADDSVGGVCGQRVIQGEERGELSGAQGHYVAADSGLKRAESRLGSVTSNDGKLYAIRRSLFRPIAPGATDDLYACLSIVEQGRRFVFEPRARAFIRTPSRGTSHELARRRRIVSRSLCGISTKRALLNPLRHGFFSIQLLINKVCRRLLPVFLTGLLASSVALTCARVHPVADLALALQLAFYLLALAHGALTRLPWRVPGLGAAASAAYYFCVGNLGTLLGLADFLRGREAIKWDPIKTG